MFAKGCENPKRLFLIKDSATKKYKSLIRDCDVEYLYRFNVKNMTHDEVKRLTELNDNDNNFNWFGWFRFPQDWYSKKNFFREINEVLPTENSKYEVLRGLIIGCGKCSACKYKRSDENVIRCLAECNYRNFENCWHITLSFDEKHLVSNNMVLPNYPYTVALRDVDGNYLLDSSGQVVYSHEPDVKYTLSREPFNMFLDRLRVRLNSKYGKGIYENMAFFGCGEYGTDKLRPHMHILFFGLPIDDLKPYKYGNGSIPLDTDGLTPKEQYMSAWIDSIWQNNDVDVLPSAITKIDVATCRYVARYVQKKNRGRVAYGYELVPFPHAINLADGYFDETDRLAPFTVFSRKNIVGLKWLKKNYPVFPYKIKYPILCRDSNGDEFHASFVESWKQYIKRHPQEFNETVESIEKLRDENLKISLSSAYASDKSFKRLSGGRKISDVAIQDHVKVKSIDKYKLPLRKDF